MKITLEINKRISGRLCKMTRMFMMMTMMMMLLGFDCMFMILEVCVVRFSHK
jgi:hypothetical protein